MSDAIAFDTYKFVKHLTGKGFTEEQAEALAIEQVNLLNSNLATKADIAIIQRDIETLRQKTKAGIEALRQETKANIEVPRQETRGNMEALKVDLLKWIEMDIWCPDRSGRTDRRSDQAVIEHLS